MLTHAPTVVTLPQVQARTVNAPPAQQVVPCVLQAHQLQQVIVELQPAHHVVQAVFVAQPVQAVMFIAHQFQATSQATPHTMAHQLQVESVKPHQFHGAFVVEFHHALHHVHVVSVTAPPFHQLLLVEPAVMFSQPLPVVIVVAHQTQPCTASPELAHQTQVVKLKAHQLLGDAADAAHAQEVIVSAVPLTPAEPAGVFIVRVVVH